MSTRRPDWLPMYLESTSDIKRCPITDAACLRFACCMGFGVCEERNKLALVPKEAPR